MTLEEVKQQLRGFGEITILEVLEIDVEEILDRFEDKILEKFDMLREELEEDNEESE